MPDAQGEIAGRRLMRSGGLIAGLALLMAGTASAAWPQAPNVSPAPPLATRAEGVQAVPLPLG
jgi:hypothetical protein